MIDKLWKLLMPPQSALLHADDGIPCLMDTPQSMACYRTIRHPLSVLLHMDGIAVFNGTAGVGGSE